VRWTADRILAGRAAAALLGLVLAACGRLGFEATEQSLAPRLGDPERWDAGAARDAEPPDAPDAVDAGMDAGEVPMMFPGPDAAFDAAADDAGADAAEPPPPDPACDSAYPVRIWPSASDVVSCVDSFGNTRTTTGPNSADYTVYEGCSTWLEFEVSAGTELRFRTFGDGCECVDCSLYHIHYQLEEDLGSGFAPQLEVAEPDDAACPGGVNIDNYTSYTTLTTRVRMQVLSGTTGSGFYFVVCGG
jgi:hypothetical protein